MKDLVDTTEMYLRTIYELEEEDITPLRARIAERLEQSGPTVSQTVARMERDGLVVVEPDRSLHMTPAGRQLATAVMRKHRLAERLLTDIIGLDVAKVHEEACRWEHVMSEEVERRLVEVLDHPESSPFGNPVPGLKDLGFDIAPVEVGMRAADMPQGASKVSIAQINEIYQVDHEQFNELTRIGISVGSIATLRVEEDQVFLTTDLGEVELMADLAHAIRVMPV